MIHTPSIHRYCANTIARMSRNEGKEAQRRKINFYITLRAHFIHAKRKIDWCSLFRQLWMYCGSSWKTNKNLLFFRQFQHFILWPLCNVKSKFVNCRCDSTWFYTTCWPAKESSEGVAVRSRPLRLGRLCYNFLRYWVYLKAIYFYSVSIISKRV